MTIILDNVKHLPKGLPIKIGYGTYLEKGLLTRQWSDLYIQAEDGVLRHLRHAWNRFLKHICSPDVEVLQNLLLEDILGHIYLDKEVDGFKVSLAQVLMWPTERIRASGSTATATATDPFKQAIQFIGQSIPVILQGRDYMLT